MATYGGTYSTGTIAVTNGSAAVTGTGVLWSDVLEGDVLWINGEGVSFIDADVLTPFNTLTLELPWPGATNGAATYVIEKVSWKRHDTTELQKIWRKLAAQLEAVGNFVFVGGATPDPEMGDDGQYALKTNASPWKLWLKVDGVWVEQDPIVPTPGSIYSPEMFGAIGDGVADDVVAFQDLALEVSGKEGVTINFGVGKDYKIWGTSPAPSEPLMWFTGNRGLTINGNGSRMFTPATAFAATNALLVFDGDTSPIQDITINNLWFEQTNFGNTTPTSTNGVNVITVSSGATNIEINNLRISGAVTGLACSRVLGDPDRAQNIRLNNAWLKSVFYPLSFQNSGDNFTGVNIHCDTPGRIYFPYNVRNHKVQFRSIYRPIVAPTIYLAAVANSGESIEQNTLANIEIDAMFTPGGPTPPGVSYYNITLAQGAGASAPAHVRNVKIHLDAVVSSDVGAVSYAGLIVKTDAGGAIDTVPRGHQLENIELSGRIDWGGIAGVDLYFGGLALSGDWTGDTVRNLIVRDYVALNRAPTAGVPSFWIDARDIAGPIVFENVTTDVLGDFKGEHGKIVQINSNVIGATAPKESLVGSRNYYVRGDGNDTNNGLIDTAAGAFATIQKAVDVVSNLDLGANNVEIFVSDGVHTAPTFLRSFSGSGTITITGDTGTPANCTISVPSGDCFAASHVVGNYLLRGFKLVNAVGSGINANGGGTAINYSQIEFGAMPGYHLVATDGARLSGGAGDRITGGAFAHFFAETGGRIFQSGVTITVTGSPAFTIFAYAQSLGGLYTSGLTFSGAAGVTGARYSVSFNAVILTLSSANPNYFPGNAAGSQSDGGQYS